MSLPVRLNRFAGYWRISGTGLMICAEYDVRTDRDIVRSWFLRSRVEEERQWLAAQQLTGVHFATRAEAVRTVTAAMAAAPLPADPYRVTLRRVAPGRYLSSDGRWAVQRDPLGRSRWQVKATDPDNDVIGRGSTGATLPIVLSWLRTLNAQLDEPR